MKKALFIVGLCLNVLFCFAQSSTGYSPSSSVISSTTITAQQGVTTTTIACSTYLSAFVDVNTQGAEINTIGTIDPTNVSTGDALLIDDNFTNLVYNNSSSGSANKPLPAIDLGSSQFVSVLSVWWWTNNTYMSQSYDIEGSDDGTNWTKVVTNKSSLGLAGQEVQLNVNDTFRYWRVWNNTGNNTSWVTISEIKAYAPGVFESQELGGAEDITIKCNNGLIEIHNNTNAAKSITTNSL